MKKTYMMPLSEVLEMNNEQMIAASGLNMDHNVKVDQLSNKHDMWGNQGMWND